MVEIPDTNDARLGGTARGVLREDARCERAAKMTCPKCGLDVDAAAIRCPRCNAFLLVGCSGFCASCAKSCAHREAPASEVDAGRPGA